MTEKKVEGLVSDRLIRRLAEESIALDLARPRIFPERQPLKRKRLNLVIPVVFEKFLQFAGPSTAVRLGNALSRHFDALRIVVTMQIESEFSPEPWPGWFVGDRSDASHSITFLGAESASLSIIPDDYFLATAWTTALLIRTILKQQIELFGVKPRRFAYLIQEYEAGYYPLSARYDYAQSTYEDDNDIIAVFNSSQLATYFTNMNLRYSQQYVFEPKLSPEIQKTYSECRGQPKEKILFVYGRPGMHRNAFELVVEALKVWARDYPSSHEWTVISAGLKHDDIPLNTRVTLKSAGILPLEDYARLLSRTWIGLTLMFSPHPSFPPLELCEFGCWVVTNSFANKDLANLSPNIISLRHPAPEDLAKSVAWCCDQFEPGKPTVCENLRSVFPDSDADEFPFVDELSERWIT